MFEEEKESFCGGEARRWKLEGSSKRLWEAPRKSWTQGRARDSACTWFRKCWRTLS